MLRPHCEHDYSKVVIKILHGGTFTCKTILVYVCQDYENMIMTDNNLLAGLLDYIL